MLHLHEEEFQVFAGHVLTGSEDIKAVIWPPGYMTTSGVAEVKAIQAMCAGTFRPRARRDQSYFYRSLQDKIFRVRTCLDIPLALA